MLHQWLALFAYCLTQCSLIGSKIYISQIYKGHIGGFIPWVAADERLLGCSPVGDVDVPLPQLHGHTADSRANTGLCLEGWDGKVAHGFEA